MKHIEKTGLRGSAIVLVLVFTSVCLIVLLGLLGWVGGNARLTQRHCQYSRCVAAAEAATEKILTQMALDYKIYGHGYVLTNMDVYRAMRPTTNESMAWAGYTFMDVDGNANKTYVSYTASTNYKGLSATYAGLKGFANSFDVISNVREVNSPLTSVGAVQQRLQLSTIPLYQFAIFYNLDLECNALPLMTVTGPVHCNANVYLTPVNGLTFNSDLTCSGTIQLTPKPGNPLPNQNGPVTFKGAHDGGVSTLSVPIGTNNSSAAVHQVIEVPPSTENPRSSLGLQRFYNKADLIILVRNTNVVISSGLVNNFATVVPWTQVTNFINTNLYFMNQREGKNVKGVEIDVGKLIKWNTNTLLNPLRAVIPGGDIRTIFVAEQRTMASSEQSGVRLINGQQLPPRGLTVATPNPLYVRGHYNCPAAYLGTTNTAGSLPASLAADAITILSTAWDDTKASGSLGSRGAADTTVNAALLCGVVQTSPSVGYSGGIENFPRFLEEWTDKTLTYSGSMVCMFDSQIATAKWNNINIYYNPPIRNWAFDNNFTDPNKLPPATPNATILVRGDWRVAQPQSTNTTVTL